MSKFWKRLLELKPDLVDSTVYFSPTKKTSLACKIHEDGSISPASAPQMRFESAVKLAETWKKGDIKNEKGSKFPRQVPISSMNFGRHFFFETGHKKSVSGIVQKLKQQPENSNQTIENDVPLPVVPTMDSGVSNNLTEGTAPVIFFVQIAQKKPCPGFDRRPHQPAITNRQWDGARYEFSPAIFEGDRCWSKTCTREIWECQSKCYDCKEAQNRIRAARRYLKKEVNEQKRIRHTPYQWLTTDEKIWKLDHLRRSKDEAIRKLRKSQRESKSLTKEITSYRPKATGNQKTVRRLVKKLDENEKKCKSPICGWVLPNGNVCGHEVASVKILSRHIHEEHFVPQIKENKKLQSELAERIYTCGWKECPCREPFPNFNDLRRHVLYHSGNAKFQSSLKSFVRK